MHAAPVMQIDKCTLWHKVKEAAPHGNTGKFQCSELYHKKAVFGLSTQIVANLQQLSYEQPVVCLCVQIAVACIKVASQAVSTMPSLFFFPILPFIMTVCLIVYWVVVAGYLYSAGTITAKYTSGSAATALTISVCHARP